jgi:chitinase
LFATFDDERSVSCKVKYAMEKKLNGVLVWELRQDDRSQHLLQAISTTIEKSDH